MDQQREDRLVLLDKARDQWYSSFPPVRDGEQIDWRQRKWLLRTTFNEYEILDVAEGRLQIDKLSTAEGKIAFDRQQCKTQRMIASAMPPHRLQQVDHLETGTEMWTEVNEIYERRMDPETKESIILRKCDDLRQLKCSPTGDVSIHLATMFRIRSDLKSYGYDFKDINMRQMMLDSLPDLYEYEQLRGSVKYGRSAEMTLDEVRALIERAAVNQSLRGKGNRATNIGSGQRQQQGGSTGARHQQQNGQNKSKNNKHGDGQRKPKSDRKNKTCHRCNEIGHFQPECTAIIDGVAGPDAVATSGGNTETNAGTQRRKQLFHYTSRGGEVFVDRCGVVEDKQGVAAGVAMVSPMLAFPGTKNEDDKMDKSLPEVSSWWCFDTGSSMHLTSNRALFVHLEEIHPESIGANVVGMAVSTLTRGSGIGRVTIFTQVGDIEAENFLDDVLYVEGASHGLFSMHLAITKQKFKISYDRAESIFSAYKIGEQVFFAVSRKGIWVFEAKRPADAPRRPGVSRVIVNYTIADGVAALK
ncbi:FOG: Transposon-encoded proteins with TYA, reverse transcriptase, integrase domains in various combinations [Plasmopara halstedii]|uniref:FOG: Transposon-encoded proteins with TYA, reverse transcriptase, integrase domains in various combinations n=1 Tax=Plasmopara halstedii TaxID=4781 RepID=A0A0P1ANE1_PLAHL|nr:FOG: Transposon-encoded proteins with TYA, reverse transcriptase, integrase domains in various combinations [Plasmopara halstedii]CEG43007.1 FOG: Transposon-encoded proteins with TYA, reverse transcriptase, integrase domains in various combinations [Plasmopara halstedii]|eukprot:XP_024579376.1 FOG: Transposon-encoded proteins with TYA, reverse transcriptase, integrase domains in various combinations [Plasmopara halstedii]